MELITLPQFAVREELRGNPLIFCVAMFEDECVRMSVFLHIPRNEYTVSGGQAHVLIACDEFGVNLLSYECKEIDTSCKESMNRIGKDTITCGILSNIPWSQ
jgi:hypothetical protein